MNDIRCDVVVIGGGHAGCEAAAAAARVGAATVLLTQSLATIGVMSCNPSIGGIGKGHLVCEIDALDGLMARAIDRAGIHFKLLNRSKGPAVRGPRAQADRDRYREAIRALLSEQAGLSLVEGAAEHIRFDPSGSVQAVVCAGGRILTCGAVVVTTGTFLRGRIFMDGVLRNAGRCGDASSERLAAQFDMLGVTLGRLKTGTPPRLARHSIRWDDLEPDDGDSDPEPFSTLTEALPRERVCCRVTHTTEQTHAIVRANLAQTATYGGVLAGPGPRYCPSIEDKIVRFPDRQRHHVFLEPEGIGSSVVYPNGISTSLPTTLQVALVRSMPGLETAEIVQPGYAVEYDYVDPRSLDHDLQLRGRRGLFLAGQINGTTGYEEAAAQGLLAGLNAARVCAAAPTVTIERGSGYLGVLVDDLVTLGVTEPYRMFTARAEYRLTLRCDNADERLTPMAIRWGLVSPRREQRYEGGRAVLAEMRAWREQCVVDGRRAQHMLGDMSISDAELTQLLPALRQVPRKVVTQLRSECLYAGYLPRQQREIAVFRGADDRQLADCGALASLSNEVRARLRVAQPQSLLAARSLEGITPAALSVLARRAPASDERFT